VFYADTDAGGVVYYAQYLRMFEQVRALYVEEYGISLTAMVEQDCQFVCRRAEIDYHSPALLDDRLDIDIWICDQGRSYLTFAYEIFRLHHKNGHGGYPRLVTATTQMVCCRKKNDRVAPRRIPNWIMKNLEKEPISRNETNFLTRTPDSD